MENLSKSTNIFKQCYFLSDLIFLYSEKNNEQVFFNCKKLKIKKNNTLKNLVFFFYLYVLE